MKEIFTFTIEAFKSIKYLNLQLTHSINDTGAHYLNNLLFNLVNL